MKSLLMDAKAFAMGYVAFTVNGRRFWRYSRARAAQQAIPGNHDVSFVGWNVWLWLTRNRDGAIRTFYIRSWYWTGQCDA